PRAPRHPRRLRPPLRRGPARGRRRDRGPAGLGAARAVLAPADPRADLREADDRPRARPEPRGGGRPGPDASSERRSAEARADLQPEPVRTAGRAARRPARAVRGLTPIWRRELAALFLG